MNRLQIITDARALMAEKTATSSYADAIDTYNWINDGIKDMCAKGSVYLKSLSISVLDGVATYKLPWEFIQVKNFLNHINTLLDPIERSNVGRVFKVTGVPLFYYFSQSPITLSAWTVATPYIAWPPTGIYASTYIVPIAANGYMYECIASGTSHATTEPTWSTTLGTKQTDNTVTWICRELISALNTIILYDAPTAAAGGIGTYSMLYSAMDGGIYDDKASPNFPEDKHRYLVPYLCYRWSMKNRDSALAMTFYQEYAAGVGLPMATGQEGQKKQGGQGAT